MKKLLLLVLALSIGVCAVGCQKGTGPDKGRPGVTDKDKDKDKGKGKDGTPSGTVKPEPSASQPTKPETPKNEPPKGEPTKEATPPKGEPAKTP